LVEVLSGVCAGSFGLVYGHSHHDSAMVLMFLFGWPVPSRVHGNRDQVAEGAAVAVAWRKGSHEAYVTVKDRLLGLQLELSRDSP
jgi:hypothetical protein